MISELAGTANRSIPSGSCSQPLSVASVVKWSNESERVRAGWLGDPEGTDMLQIKTALDQRANSAKRGNR